MMRKRAAVTATVNGDAVDINAAVEDVHKVFRKHDVSVENVKLEDIYDSNTVEAGERSTEDIYDQEIHGLMAQVLAICSKHRIGVVMDFAVENKDKEEIHVSTCLVGPEYHSPQMHLAAQDLIMKGFFAFAVGHHKPTEKGKVN